VSSSTYKNCSLKLHLAGLGVHTDPSQYPALQRFQALNARVDEGLQAAQRAWDQELDQRLGDTDLTKIPLPAINLLGRAIKWAAARGAKTRGPDIRQQREEQVLRGHRMAFRSFLGECNLQRRMMRQWYSAYAQLSVCLRLATGSGTFVMRSMLADQLTANKRVRGEGKILKLDDVRFDSWLTRRHSFKKSQISASN
jgi:hypothetical protein